LNNDPSTSSQQVKDISTTSKLSATAATFSQGASLTANSPTGAVIFNPVSYSMSSYVPPHHDRSISYPSIDNRVSQTMETVRFHLFNRFVSSIKDNRTGAANSGYRNYYQQAQPQQQRLHHNSMWHSQQ
jgi:hypothetical protein